MTKYNRDQLQRFRRDPMINIEDLNPNNIPRHIAIIMDGNGRWAKAHAQERTFGHRQGVESVRNVTEAASKIGVEYLTLYAFSTENWQRPKEEINALMSILVSAIENEEPTLQKNNIRLTTIGNIDSLYPETTAALRNLIDKTKNNTRMTLILALSYSGRWEITEAVKNIVKDVQKGTLFPEDISSEKFEQYLNTAPYPDPELLIRTSGEYRLSNYLLWQLAYSELYFTPVLWPDFGEQELYAAVMNYQSRERRFGKTTEQIQKEQTQINPSA